MDRVSLLVSLSILGFRHALNVQIFIKMHRSDFAEKQLRIMQQLDEDHTLTQLANAWLDLAVVKKKKIVPLFYFYFYIFAIFSLVNLVIDG